MKAQVRVLVVDNSALMRRWLKDLLESDPDIEVIATAKNGDDALKCLAREHPDVVTLDVDMPDQNGLEVLQHITQHTPVPVVVVTGLTQPEIAAEAKAKGAVDVVLKPSGPLSLDLYKIRDELVHKVKAAAQHMPDTPAVTTPSCLSATISNVRPYPYWGVIIGASTGGPRAVEHVLQALPAELPATVVVVQHMPAGFTCSFAARLDQQCALPVVEASNHLALKPGQVVIAPGDYHLRIAPTFPYPLIHLDRSPPIKGLRPAVDLTLMDAAAVWGPRTIGVILTGMGRDGLEGAQSVKDQGGIIIAQDRETSVVYGMPRAVAEAGIVDAVLPLAAIPNAIVDIICRER